MIDALSVPDVLVQVAVAIAIGGLIGAEREKKPDKYVGLRTLALLCGSAPPVVAVSRLAETAVPVGIYLVLAGALAVMIVYVRLSMDDADLGFTTSVTVFLVALLGLLVGYGFLFEATSIAIVTAFLLAEKERLHAYVDRLSYRELSDSVKLGALVFILYPILPSEPVDPYGVVRPREVLLFAIFVLLIQFAAYISMRQFGGSRGLQVTGVLAGGVNSFATAGVMARMANRSPDAIDSAAAALLLATGSMIVRNVGIASVLAVSLLWALWLPTLAMLAVAAVLVAVIARRATTHEEFDLGLTSPFSFEAAAKFSVAYVTILVASVLARELFGDPGLYVAAFAGGLVSSAAVAVSAATVFNEGGVGAEPAAAMVVLGITASLCSKIVLVEFVNGQMRTKAVVPMALIGITGIVTFAVV